ncbi:hypothetical protein [Streptomyces cinnamoneus]|uniref:hypothetical protein n=1 Tax=Streptomyces cinnamoneus TaxID=53446 RepID=UPI0037B7B501
MTTVVVPVMAVPAVMLSAVEGAPVTTAAFTTFTAAATVVTIDNVRLSSALVVPALLRAALLP